jgi:outer membrane protein OmpA-like peptidoglycan-associated protein
MAEFLDLYPDTSVELQGFTNHLGSHSHNLKLSKQRASNVKKILMRYGVNFERISIVGFGDSKTSHSQDSAQDRKVIATVVGSKKSPDKEWTIFSKLEY